MRAAGKSARRDVRHGYVSTMLTSCQVRSSCASSCSADSWRARVSHICELQVNLASGAMTIDFGGMDRWDYPERVRNMEEAEKMIA